MLSLQDKKCYFQMRVLSTRKQNTGEVILQIPSSLFPSQHCNSTNTDRNVCFIPTPVIFYLHSPPFLDFILTLMFYVRLTHLPVIFHLHVYGINIYYYLVHTKIYPLTIIRVHVH